jgi:hypothetical protein
MASPREQLESLERAVQEIEALEAIYGFDEGGFTVHSEAELLLAQSAVESGVVLGDGTWVALQLEIELQVTLDEVEGAPTARLRCRFPPGYPESAAAAVSVSVGGMRRSVQDELSARLTEKAHELLGDEAAMELVQELQDIAPAVALAASSAGDSELAEPEPEPELTQLGLMREWCSFVSLYKDSYCSGPNRFEVMTELATQRDLNITGMAIAGKPGGLVVEGVEKNVIAFMELMRTEFFETLNPRGRKLTTRWQERWPLDEEAERYEAAAAAHRLRGGGAEEGGTAPYAKLAEVQAAKFKVGEKERLRELQAADRAMVEAWESGQTIGQGKWSNGHGAAGKTAPTTATATNGGGGGGGRRGAMTDDDIAKLLAAGPPDKCTTAGIYPHCGVACVASPSAEEVESRRLFKDFSVLTVGPRAPTHICIHILVCTHVCTHMHAYAYGCMP